MASKAAKTLKPKDVIHVAPFDGTRSYVTWAEVSAVDKIRVWSSVLPTMSEFIKVTYKPISGLFQGDEFIEIFEEEKKLRIPNKPNKLVRIWRALWS